jgi:hypothetical protein
MIQAYDHRAASVVVDETKWGRQGQTAVSTPVQHQNPEYVVQPRWWVAAEEVAQLTAAHDPTKVIAFKNVTSPTNQRTMIAAFIPRCGVIHSAPLVFTDAAISPRLTACLLANLNSFVYDYVCRQKIGGVNLSYFIINQLPALPPSAYADRCPWDARQTLEKWVSERVLKLTCTANDMKPLAAAAGFAPGVHLWKEAERYDLMAQLDAAYFLLYGIGRDDAAYILSTFSGLGDATGAIFGTQAQKTLTHYDRLASRTP